MNAARWRGQQIAAQVQAARRRAFTCHHDGPRTCDLCIVERIAAREGRPTRFETLATIRGRLAFPHGGILTGHPLK